MDSDFKKVGDCIGRPEGWARLFMDFICRKTGHLFWRSGSVYRPAGDSLDVHTVHCRRCFVWGYVQGDYVRPTKL